MPTATAKSVERAERTARLEAMVKRNQEREAAKAERKEELKRDRVQQWGRDRFEETADTVVLKPKTTNAKVTKPARAGSTSPPRKEHNKVAMLKEAKDGNAIVPSKAKENEPPKQPVTNKHAGTSNGQGLKQRKRKVEVDHDPEPIRKRTRVSASTQKALDRANMRDAEQERLKEEQLKLKFKRKRESEDEEETMNKKQKENKEEKQPTRQDLNRLGRFAKKRPTSPQEIRQTRTSPKAEAAPLPSVVQKPKAISPSPATPRAESVTKSQDVPEPKTIPTATHLTKKGIARKVVKKSTSPAAVKVVKPIPAYKGVAAYIASHAEGPVVADASPATKSKGLNSKDSTKESVEKTRPTNSPKSALVNKGSRQTYEGLAPVIASHSEDAATAKASKATESKQESDKGIHTQSRRAPSSEEGEPSIAGHSGKPTKTPDTVDSPGEVKLILDNCPTPRANTPAPDNDSIASPNVSSDEKSKLDKDPAALSWECPTPRAGTPVSDDGALSKQHEPIMQVPEVDENGDQPPADCPTPRASNEAQEPTEIVQTAESLGEAEAQETAGQDQDVDQGLKVKDDDEKVLEPKIIDRSTIEDKTQTCKTTDEGEKEPLRRQSSEARSVLGKRSRDDGIPASKAKKAKTESSTDSKSENADIAKGPNGLANHKRACYANSVLQMLATIEPLRAHCKTADRPPSMFFTDPAADSRVRKMSSSIERKAAICAFVKELWANRKLPNIQHNLTPRLSMILEAIAGAEAVDNKQLDQLLPAMFHQCFASSQWGTGTRSSEWNGEQPQESAEYFDRLLHQLIIEADRKKEKAIAEMFSVKTRTEIICPACGEVSRPTPTSALTLSVDLPRDTEDISLEKLLDDWRKGDTISGWRCGECHQMADAAQKTVHIQQMGEYVMLDIRRTDNMGKILRSLVLPDGNLDLGSCSDPSAEPSSSVYSIVGAVEHHSKRSILRRPDGAPVVVISNNHEDGHYTAHVKHDAIWWHCNDHIVSRLPTNALQGCRQATMVLLKRQSTRDSI